MRALRVLIAILGLDGHEVGAVAAARILRDAGMEVLYLGRFNTPESVMRSAIDEDVDVIGLSAHSWEYLYYIDELLERLKSRRVPIPVVIGGSVMTPSDEASLLQKGVAAILGPSSSPPEVAEAVRNAASGSSQKSHVH